MSETLSFGWWLGAAITGVIATVGIPVAKSKIQQRIKKDKIQNAVFNAEVDKIIASEHYRMLMLARISHHYGKAAFLGFASLLAFFFGAAIQGAAGMFSWLFFAAGIVGSILATIEMKYGKTCYEQIKTASENDPELGS